MGKKIPTGNEKKATKADSELDEVLASVDELAKRGRITRNRAFAAWYAMSFFDVEEDEALESAAADGGNDQGIDIAFADTSAEELLILQAHCPENIQKQTPLVKWNALISAVPFLKDPALISKAGRPDLAESLQSLRCSYPDYKMSVGLISLGLRSEAIERSLQAHVDDGAHKDLTFFYEGQEDIRSKYKALLEAEAGIPEDELHFSGNHFEDTGDYGRAWIGSVSAAELKRLHGAHKEKLFAGNIRLFLGSRKGGINEQIIKTAKTAPGTFWALNNGITIVADSAGPTPDDEGGSKLRLRRFSIVNGCQTTSSLVRADADASAKVLTRVIAAKSGLKNEIVRYNNSQNAVKIWTVRAADDVQQQLRADFGSAGISYAPKQEGSRKKKDPSIIELDKVTQYLASSEQRYLIQAIDNKSELFDEPYQQLFRKGIKATAVYLAWMTGNAADTERQRILDGLGSDPNASLLGVTAGYWIIFCTYKILGKFSDLGSSHITLARMNTSEFKNALAKYVGRAASMFYDAAVDTYDHDEYGSFKSTLRSGKFLQKIDSKINSRILKIEAKALPDLAVVCRSAKVES